MVKGKKTLKGKARQPHALAIFVGYTVIWAILAGLAITLLGLGLWLLSLLDWRHFFECIDPSLILEYVKVLVWPLFFVLVLVVFRKDVKQLLPRMVKAHLPGGFSGEFDSAQKPPSEDDKEEIDELNANQSTAGAPSSDSVEEEAYKNPEVKLAFERIYRDIFTTQYLALNFLAAHPGRINASLLNYLYDRHKSAMPGTPYKTIQDLMQYLVNFGLVTYHPESDTYQIQVAGSLFLRYLASQGLTADDKNY